MSEKLLTKPPFKYIFDILTETTKVNLNFKIKKRQPVLLKDYMMRMNLMHNFMRIEIGK